MEDNQEVIQEQQEEQQEQHEEPRFTQAEVDAIINKRFAKWKKDQPSEEELAEFRAYKKANAPKEDDTVRLKEALEELSALKADREIERRERYIERMGISDEVEVSVYVSKITGKQEDPNDFEEFKAVADKFLKDHKPKSGVRVDMGGRLSGGGGKKTANEAMNDLIRGARS